MWGTRVDRQDEELVRRLIDRLEHLSVDSIYAHRASGLRGSLLQILERLEAGETLNSQEQASMEGLLEHGYTILGLAAKELRMKK